jgi:hypothetical protein
MKRLAGWHRRLVVAALVLVVVVGVLRQILVWGGATSAVARGLEPMLGARVSIASSRVHLLGNSALSDLKLYEEGQDQPCLQAHRVVADVSAAGYLLGRRTPHHLDIDRAHLRLRFDAAGNLLTHIEPTTAGGELPAIRLRDSALTIEQEGRPSFTIEGVTLDLRGGDGQDLSGRIADPAWGPLEIAGTVDPQSLAVSLTLVHQGLELDMKKLRALPFAPASLWSHLELEGKTVPLRLTIRTASAPPRIRYRAEFSRLRIRLPQPDRPAFTAGGARGVLDGNEDGFHVNGAVDDPSWGKWTVAAHLATRTGDINLKLDTPDVSLDQARLESLPYVPKKVWEQVRQIRGRTAARVSVDLSTVRPDIHYRVELKVAQTQVEVAAIGLLADSVSGGIVVEDGEVVLDNIHGKTAGGQISLNGLLDFRKEPSRLHFKVKARDLALKQLPKKWDLPEQIEGKLGGAADLTVVVRPDRVITRGSGKGQIEDARVLGLRTSEPIELTLQADGDGLRFLTPSALLNTFIALVRPGVAPPPKRSLPHPGEAVGQVTQGVSWATGKFAEGAGAALSGLGRFGRSMKPGQPTTYLNARIALDNIDLAELIRRARVELPKDLPIAGRVSLHLALGIPINKATEYRIYRLDGSATSEKLSVAGVDFRKLAAQVNYRNGVLRLEKLAGEVGGGQFAGTASAAVFPRGDLSVNLDMTEVPLSALERLVPGGGRLLAGSVSGKVTASTPLAALTTPQKWQGKASLRSAVVDIGGLAIKDVWANVVLGGGKLSVADLRGEVGGAPLRGTASLSLLDRQRVSARVSVRGMDMAVVRPMLPASWRSFQPGGKADLRAEMAGTLSPFTVEPKGRLEARGLRLGGVRASSLSLGWRIRDQVLDLQSIEAKLYRGTVAGTASLPLVGDKRPISVNLKVHNIDAAALAKALGGLPVEVAGRLSGMALATMRPARGGWEGNAEVTSPRLTIRGIPATGVRGSVKWRGNRADYRIDGEVLGGTFSVDGTYPPPPMRSVGRYDGRIEVRRVLLRLLVEALGLGERFRPLHGVFSLRLPYRLDGPGGRPVGDGSFDLRDVRFGDNELTDNLTGTIRLGSDGLFIRDIDAYLAGGQLRLRAAYRFRDPERSWFSLNLERADLGRLVAFDPDLRNRFNGMVDVMLRGTLGGEWMGAGSIILTRGRAFGIEVSEWRIPVEFSLAPSQERLEVVARESGAQLGAGRALVNITLRTGRTTRVEGNVRLLDAGLKSLSGITGDISSYATGRVSGRIDLGGSEMRSMNDLTANVQLTLRDTQALQLPVLSVLTPYLLPGQGATTFNTGELKGQLAGGVFRISMLTLEAPVASMMLEGNVTVAGRLDLEVVARTTPLGGINPVLARLLLSRIPAVGPVPVGLILQATNLFANRVVRLHVTGTIQHPVAQVKPLQLLSDEAVRYFLNRALGTTAAFP